MPHPRSARRAPAMQLAVVVAGLVALLASTLNTPARASTPVSRQDSATQTHAAAKHERRFVRAKQALVHAQQALSPDTSAVERPDATLALRELWLLKDALSPTDRAIADRLAARPHKPAVLGNAHILIHYDPAEVHGYTPQQALDTLTYVSDTYAGSGYRRPKSDGTRGGDGRIDIYLAPLEDLYGYCNSDQQRLRPGRWDAFAYCVLDNDYAGFEHTPLQNLQVTAAHEYYHATQYAYDVNEDGWFLESTATWAEDEMYDDVDDNVQYLDESPMGHPRTPMDRFFGYGVWIYFRYLTERYPAETGALPELLLRMWRYADSTKGPRRNLYSTLAIDKALRKTVHSSLAKSFAQFSAATRFPGLFSEGVANGYPAKPLAGRTQLAKGKRRSFSTELDHLSSATYRFVPGRGTTKLRLHVQMASKVAGSRARVVVVGADGSLVPKLVRINRRGMANTRVDFRGNVVAAVEVTLVNASNRDRACLKGDPPICQGPPREDNQRAQVLGTAF